MTKYRILEHDGRFKAQVRMLFIWCDLPISRSYGADNGWVERRWHAEQAIDAYHKQNSPPVKVPYTPK